MKRLILLTGAVLVVCGEVALAQAPMKNGCASVRERSYILTAKRAYKQQLSIAEARKIAQTEDKIAAQSQDKKGPYLLDDYLLWRAYYYKQLQAKQKAAADAKYLAEAPLRMEQQMKIMQWYLMNLELQRMNESMSSEHWFPDGRGGYDSSKGRHIMPDGRGGFDVYQ